nr:hypothetical protein CFP56_16098 [Quercus suber]
MTPELGMSLGNSIGKAVCVAELNDDGVIGRFLRVRVTLDVSKPLSRGRKLKDNGVVQFGSWLRAELERPVRKVSATPGVFAQAGVLPTRPVTEIPTPSSTPNGSAGRTAREAANPPVASEHKLVLVTSDLATEKFERTLHEIDTELGWNPDGMDVSLERTSRDKCDLKEADSVDRLRNLYKSGPSHSKVDNGLSVKAVNGLKENKEPPHSQAASTSKLRSPLVDISNRPGPSRVNKVISHGRRTKVTRKSIPTPSDDVLLKFIRKRPNFEPSDAQPLKRRAILQHDDPSPETNIIAGLPLSLNLTPDLQTWFPSSQGNYTTRSAYQMLAKSDRSLVPNCSNLG